MTGDKVRSGGGRFATILLPSVILICAGFIVRMPIAAANPTIAISLFAWVVSDTIMLALLANYDRHPSPQLILGTLAAASLTIAFALPPSLRETLWEMPVVVGTMSAVVAAHMVWGSVRARRAFLAHRDSANTRWSESLSEILPPPLVRLAAAEVAIIHMALFRWGGSGDVPPNTRAFSYHRHLTPICAALLVLSAIEMAVYHLFVGHWNRSAAIVMFVFSDLGFVYLVGLIKSFRFRPVLITEEGVRVRAGFLIDQMIPFTMIARIEASFDGASVRDPATLNAALLAWPNILLRLNAPILRRSLTGKQQEIRNVAFRLDNPTSFVRMLQWRWEIGDAA